MVVYRKLDSVAVSDVADSVAFFLVHFFSFICFIDILY